MKKLCVLLLSLVTWTSYGQFSKGTLMLGGSVGASFNAEKYKTGSTTTVTGHDRSFFMSPQGGYFVLDRLAVGAAMDLESETQTEENSDYKQVTSSASLAPFARYYYQNFYGQAAFQVGSGKTRTTNDGGTNESKYSLSGWSLAAGYAFFLNESIAIEPQIGYQNVGNKYSGYKDISSGLFLHIGFQIYFKKH